MRRRTLAGSTFIAAALVVSAAGWMATGRTVAQARLPVFEPDPLWSQALPNKWVTGQVGGVAVDSHDNVWVFHRPDTIPDGEKAARSLLRRPSAVFRTRGARVRFERKVPAGVGCARQRLRVVPLTHGIFVDRHDNVWLSGSAQEDNHLLKFTTRAVPAADRPRRQEPRQQRHRQPWRAAGLFVDEKTNELYVADGYFNHRVVVFDAQTGKYKRHWGAYGKPPDDTLKFRRVRSSFRAGAAGFGNPVHAVLVSNDDLVYVGDRSNNRLQVFRKDGTFVKETFIARNTLQAEGTVHAFATSPDKEQRLLYVVDGSNKAVRVLDRQTLQLLGSIGGHAGHNAREFFHIHGIAADSKGNLFLGEVNNGQRYYKYAFKGVR
jgi:hypothetical protein